MEDKYSLKMTKAASEDYEAVCWELQHFLPGE